MEEERIDEKERLEAIVHAKEAERLTEANGPCEVSKEVGENGTGNNAKTKAMKRKRKAAGPPKPPKTKTTLARRVRFHSLLQKELGGREQNGSVVEQDEIACSATRAGNVNVNGTVEDCIRADNEGTGSATTGTEEEID